MNNFLKLSLVVILLISFTQCSDDSDPKKNLPSLSINDAAGEEGEYMVFTVTLSAPSTETVQFKYKTTHVSTDDDDFETVSTPIPLAILAGQTSVEINIGLYQDANDEQSEKFHIILSDPTNAQLSDDITGTGTINNGPAPFFLKMKVDGQQWTATMTTFFDPEFFYDSFAGYGTGAFSDSQVEFNFNEDPIPGKTYSIVPDGYDADELRVYYSPTFFSSSGLGTTYEGQEGGTVTITKYDVVKKEAEGTFSTTVENESNQTHVITEGQFRIKIGDL